MASTVACCSQLPSRAGVRRDTFLSREQAGHHPDLTLVHSDLAPCASWVQPQWAQHRPVCPGRRVGSGLGPPWQQTLALLPGGPGMGSQPWAPRVLPASTRTQAPQPLSHQPLEMTWGPTEASVWGWGTVGTIWARSRSTQARRNESRTSAPSPSPSAKWAVTPDWGVIDARLTLMKTTHPSVRSHGPRSQCVESSQTPWISVCCRATECEPGGFQNACTPATRRPGARLGGAPVSCPSRFLEAACSPWLVAPPPSLRPLVLHHVPPPSASNPPSS